MTVKPIGFEPQAGHSRDDFERCEPQAEDGHDDLERFEPQAEDGHDDLERFEPQTGDGRNDPQFESRAGDGRNDPQFESRAGDGRDDPQRFDRQAGERRGNPEQQRERARAIAWRALNRRARTEFELRGILTAKRVDPLDCNAVLGELREGGYVDDAEFARAFADDRRRLDGWGSDRIARRLGALGVANEEISAAIGTRDREAELDAAVALLARRIPDPPRTPRERDRALGMLLRKGYELELARDALRRHAGADGLD